MNYIFYPYLFKAIYDWFVENDANPRILVQARMSYVVVPRDFVNSDGTIILGIHPRNISEMQISDHTISFIARFKGKPTKVVVPYNAIEEFFCSEKQIGIKFFMWASALCLAMGISEEGSIDSVPPGEEDMDALQEFHPLSEDDKEQSGLSFVEEADSGETEETAAPKAGEKSAGQKHEKPTFSFIDE